MDVGDRLVLNCRTGPPLDAMPEEGGLSFVGTYSTSYTLYFVIPFTMHYDSIE